MQATLISPPAPLVPDAALLPRAAIANVAAPGAAQPREGRAQRQPRSWRYANEGEVDRSRWMDVQQRQIGAFRIVAGALDAPGGEFVAAVEVHRVDAAGDALLIFGSEHIADGHRFARAALALRHALDVGHQAVRLHRSRGA